MTTKTKNTKNDRIDLRAKTDQKEYLSYAASLANMKLSSFILCSALKSAQEIVTEKINFSLPAKQWNSFCEALDRPAQEVSKLKKLFSKPVVFDE